MEEIFMTTALTTISTASRSLFNRYYHYLWRHDYRTSTSRTGGKFSITVFGLDRDEADHLTEQLASRFHLVKIEEATGIAA